MANQTTTEPSFIDFYLESYNARLFPLRKYDYLNPKSKQPLYPGWRDSNGPQYSAVQLQEKLDDYHSIGWALGPEDLVIDVDVPSEQRPNKKGLESLERLKQDFPDLDLDNCPRVESPTGGRHYYLKKPADISIRKTDKNYPDIEFLREGCFVVIAGCPHWQGGNYELKQGDAERPDSESLVASIAYTPKSFSGASPGELSATQLDEILSHIDPRDYAAHDEWLGLAMASHAGTNGDPEALAAFQAWSAGNSEFSGLGDEVARRWASFRADGGYKIGTLYKAAFETSREAGDCVRRITALNQLDEFETDEASSVFSSGNVKTRIIDHFDESLTTKKIIGELVKQPSVFQQNNNLVDVIEFNGVKKVVEHNRDSLRGLITHHCSFGTYTKDEETGEEKFNYKRPPERIFSQVYNALEYPEVRQLRRLVHSPLFCSDGRIIQDEGYDEATGVYFDPRGVVFPKVPEAPTREECEKAALKLLDLVFDFPFASEASRNMFLAAVLTVVAHEAIQGPCPLFFVYANEAGSGKSILTKLVSTITSGENQMSSLAFTPSEEELNKLLLPVLKNGKPVVVFDNVKTSTKFGSPVFDAILTSTHWTGRKLGSSQTIDVEIRTVLFATGNNPAFSHDILRRIAPIELLSEEENPEDRKNFKHGPEYKLLDYANRNRPELVNAALTILKGFHAAGRPKSKQDSWGSFNAFSDLIPAAIEWIGLENPLKARKRLKGQMPDSKNDSLNTTMAALIEIFNRAKEEEGKELLRARDLLRYVNVSEFKDTSEPLDDLHQLLLATNKPINPKTLGEFLREFINRKRFNHRLVIDEKTRGGSNQYRLQKIT